MAVSLKGTNSKLAYNKKEELQYDPTTGTLNNQQNNLDDNQQPGPYAPKSSSGGSSAKKTTTPTATTTTTTQQVTATAPDYSAYAYDPSTNAAYTNAMAALEKAKGELPQYAGTYDGQLDALYQQIVGRGPFQYDLNEDMFYQQAADQYQKLGNMAMMDTMGQAAALTGGYGNTYAQNVGQQAYQGYLQQLNDNIPQYYQMALDAYNAQGDQMMQQYGLLGDLADREYGKYQDELANYWQNVGHLQDVADTEYGRGYENWYNAYQMGTTLQNQNYDRLVSMMTSMGYKPSAEEIAAAGMTSKQAELFQKYYANTHKKSSGGGTKPITPTPTYNDIYEEAMSAMRNGEGLSAVTDLTVSAVKAGVLTQEQRSKITNAALNLYNTLR